MHETHFQKRCRQRGVSGVNLVVLQDEIERAVADGNEDFAEMVFRDMGQGSSLYRFQAPSGIFYAVVNSTGKAVTAYNQEIMKNVRSARKLEKKHHRRKGGVINEKHHKS